MTIQRYERNKLGRDFAVGDIHGHFKRLQAVLDKEGFNSSTDRLFSVGDLVDRGPESKEVLEWLAKPWFHAVKGNHEDVAVRFAKGNPVDLEVYRANGGGWFIDLEPSERLRFAQVFEALPFAIEVVTAHGLVGLVHADCPQKNWANLDAALRSSKSARSLCIWSRARLETEYPGVVAGVRAVVVGHTPLSTPVVLGNVYHIDTGGWQSGGHFTLLDLNTLSRATRLK
jgi:serine/threonine protein phosphatase 1